MSSEKIRLNAPACVAVGTVAGWLAINSFGLPKTVFSLIYKYWGGFFEAVHAYPAGELIVAAFLYRLPSVLAIGLLLGLILRYAGRRRLLLCSVLVWPTFKMCQMLLTVFLLEPGYRGAGFLFLRTNVSWEMAILVIHYLCLFLILITVDVILERMGVRNLVRTRQVESAPAGKS